MLAKVIFFASLAAAILTVVLLAMASPPAYKKSKGERQNPSLVLSLYIQPPCPHNHRQATLQTNEAFVFHHVLTEGPKNVSRVIGRAQGFIIPIEHFARSAFNIIYLTFNTPEYSGSISVEARNVRYKAKEELTVVGGTGSFAFARGVAVLARRDHMWMSDPNAMYHLNLRLWFPAQMSSSSPG